MKDNVVNDTEGVCARQSGGVTGLSIDIRSFLAIAFHNPYESPKLHQRSSWCLHQPMNERNK